MAKNAAATTLGRIKRWKATEIETTDGPGLVVLKSDMAALIEELAESADADEETQT